MKGYIYKYTFPDGTTKTLTQMVLGDRKVDKVNHNKCDLLYLLEDYSVYCLDFNIEYQSYTFCFPKYILSNL